MSKTEIFNYKGWEVRLSSSDAFSTKKRFLADSWMFEQFYNVIDKFVSSSPKDSRTFVDVGANYGFTSLEFLQKYCTKSIMFEPSVVNYECLKSTFDDLPFDVQIHNIGLYDKKTTLKFNYEKTKSGTSHISSDGSIDIEVDTLDSFNLDEVFILKIDVEGFELEVVNGAVLTIRKNKPLIIFECNNTDVNKTDDLFKKLHELDYYILSKSNHLVETSKDVDILNISPSFISTKIVDLVALPKDIIIDNLTVVDKTFIKESALSKLNSKKSVFIDKILYEPVTSSNKLYDHLKNGKVSFVDSDHFTPIKSNKKVVYRLVDNIIYKTYQILLKD